MRRLVLVPLLALAATLATPLPAGAEEAPAPRHELEAELVRLVNEERADRGLPQVRVTVQQQRKAREHSAVMAERDHLHHGSDLAGDVFPGDAWTGMAENVVRRYTPETAHEAFMDSPPHRDNMLDERWTHVGVGIAVDGRDLWVTQRFISVKPGRSLPLFRDMPAGGWRHDAVVTGWRRGMLRGCAEDRVCPDDGLTRAQMASLLTRIAGRTPDPDAARRFDDVDPASPHAGAIGALADAGVTRGCREGSYCPGEPLSRGAMASFIVRAKSWDGLLEQRFADVAPGHTHAATINRLDERGVTQGCTSARYCPERAISRVEAARLVARAF